MSAKIRNSKSKSVSSLPINTWDTKLKQSSKSNLNSSGSFANKKLLNASSFNNSKSVDFSFVESEYIRNLQQQIYYLELECQYLNEERTRMMTVPASINLEAEKMMRRVKSMQSEIRVREKEILEKDSTIDMLQRHKDSNLTEFEKASVDFATEKKELITQIVLLKKEIETMEIDATKANAEYETINANLLKSMDESRLIQSEKNDIQKKLHETLEELSCLRVSHEEKQVDYIKLQTDYQELEERFFRSKVNEKEKIDNQLKEEIKTLHYQLREKEIQAERDKALRLKIADDCGALVKENAALSSQAIEYQKQLTMERDFNKKDSHRKKTNIQELVTLKEERKINAREIEKYKELYELEKEKYRSLLDKQSIEEDVHAKAKLQNIKLQAELEEVGGLKSLDSEENVRLRRDNLLLSDKVTDLQAKLRGKEDEVDNLKSDLLVLKRESKLLESKYRHMSSFDQIKWDEFELMADQMKTLSRNISPALSSSIRKSKEVDFET